MKTKLTIATVFCFLAPSLAFADGLTQTQVSAVIGLMEAFGVSQSVILQVAADLEPENSTPVLSIPNTENTKTSYETVTFAQYYDNPSAYLGQDIVITGAESAFLPATSAATTNYVQITNLYDISEPSIEINIPGESTYTATVNALQGQYMPTVMVYGVGAEDHNFTRSNAYGTNQVSLPTITATNIDLCTNGNSNATYNGSDYNGDYSCSDWVPVGK